MIAIRSDRLSASIWSWVTNITVTLTRCCSDFNSRRISSRNWASRLLNGSSSNKTLGENTKARASATRCCCPPLSAGAGRSSRPARPTSAKTSATLFSASAPLMPRSLSGYDDVLKDRHMRPQRIGLKHHAHVALFRFDEQFLRVGNQTAVGKINRPAVGFFQSADHAQASSSCRNRWSRAG